MAKLINLPGSRPINEGERKVVGFLEKELPNSYSLIPNAEIIEAGRPAFEYDLIVIAPHALYVVEIKNWRGGIEGDDFTWVVAREHIRQNPWSTTNNKSRVLKSKIEALQPSIGRFWVEAIVVIADEYGEINLSGEVAKRVFRYTELPDVLKDASLLRGKVNDLKSVRGYLENAIQDAARGRQEGAQRFGDYEVAETLSRRDSVSEYLARSILLRSAAPVRIRVFSYNPYLEESELAHRREVIRREAEALQKIGPHPNLIALQGYFTAPEDPNLFVEITEWSSEGTLRSLLSTNAPLSLERKLELGYGIAAGLKSAHEAGVIHRDVRPGNILIGRDKQPRLMNFDHARITITGAKTVSPIKYDTDVPRNYIAPELLDPTKAASPATDIYSLGVILFELLVGQTLFESPEEARDENTAVGGPASFDGAEIPPMLNDLVKSMMHPKPEKRPQSAEEVLNVLKEIREKPSQTIDEEVSEEAASVQMGSRAQEAAEPALFDIGDVIDQKYQVQKRLEAGGSGRVYKVFDGIFEYVYALKLFESTNLSLENLKREVQSLKDLDHPNIVKVITWGKLAQTGRFYLVSEFVEGEDLFRYTTPEQRLPVREAVKVILDLLDALAFIHPNVDRIEELRKRVEISEITQAEYEEFQELKNEGLLHRDIKPANLMLTPDGLKLIDFNIAARVRDAGATYVGTPGYMLPEVGIDEWRTDGDLFATGIVLYELVTGHHPYTDRKPNAGEQPTDPRIFNPDLSTSFAELLLRAVSCSSQLRYKSARKFMQDLLDLREVYFQAVEKPSAEISMMLADWEINKPNYNPYVTRFLKLYSQAAKDNSGTRGLDEIARLTYVDTRLDQLLRPEVLDGQYRLVIITGNAGDGKTAFIQSMERIVEGSGGSINRITQNSSHFVYKGIQFYTNYDGSQDEGEQRANDQVLTEFFAPFGEVNLDSLTADQTHVIAINEGRLIDFFQNPVSQEHLQQISQWVMDYFDPDANGNNKPAWLQIVDLNRRSIVAQDPEVEDQSIFERQLQRFLQPAFWEPCTTCALQKKCFIKFNIDTLADPASGSAVQERIRTLFEIVHLRRQLHITMRDMRSAISWLLFQDHDCDSVADLLETSNSPENQLQWFYFNAFSHDGEPPRGRTDDRLVRLLRQVDPSQTSNPATDRSLHFSQLSKMQLFSFESRTPIPSGLFNSWRVPAGWEAAQDPNISASLITRHQMLRRLAYYERRGDDWKLMLPYQTFFEFKQLTEADGQDQYDVLRDMLVEGISLAEGARNPELSKEYICLQAGQQNKGTLKSFRLFPRQDFQIMVPLIRSHKHLEYTPDRIIFYHSPQDKNMRLRSARAAELVLSLDLYELLYQIRNGFVPSPNDVEGFFLNLVIFKNALSHLPFRRVLLTPDDQIFYEVIKNEDATINMHRWTENRISQ